MKEFLKKLGRRVTGKKGIGDTVTVAIIIAVVMLNIFAYAITNAFGLYFYSPDVDDLTISGNTDELFANALLLGKKVTITFCYAEDKLEKHDTGSLVLTTAREFEKRYPELIELRFVSLLTKMDENGVMVDMRPYSTAVCSAEIDGKKCNSSTKYDDLNPENPRCSVCGEKIDLNKDLVYSLKQNSVIFESGEGQNRSCRVITDNATSAGFVDFYTLDGSGSIISYNGEEVIAAMISWVLHTEHPVAYFTQNHGETADVAFSNLLTCAGYYVEVINLRKSEIPENASVIIISNPTSDFELSVANADVRGEINKLEDYLKGGGSLYVALDPYTRELKNLEALLTKWGITVSSTKDENGTNIRNIVRENSNAITTDGFTFVATHADNEVSGKILDKVQMFGNDRVLVSEVARLELDESLGAQPILISSGSSSTHAGGETTDTKGGYAVAAYSQRSEADGKQSTVFVIPTAYITAGDTFISESYSNKDFLYATLEVLFDANPAPRGCNRVTYRSSIIENLTMGRAKAYTVIILMIPAALAVLGTVTIIRRKNR